MDIRNLLGHKLFLFIAVFLTAAIGFGSTFSATNIIGIQPFNFFDKVLHIGAYGTLTLSWLMYFGDKKDQRKYAYLTAFFVLIYGTIIEVIQGTLTANRQADFYDIIANLVGIVTAMLFFGKFLQKK
jgi:VanZ family protein